MTAKVKAVKKVAPVKAAVKKVKAVKKVAPVKAEVKKVKAVKNIDLAASRKADDKTRKALAKETSDAIAAIAGISAEPRKIPGANGTGIYHSVVRQLKKLKFW